MRTSTWWGDGGDEGTQEELVWEMVDATVNNDFSSERGRRMNLASLAILVSSESF